MTAKYTGQCFCGEIRYAIDAEPVFTGNCHCKDCQRTSGSAFIPGMIFHERAVVVSGAPKYFVSKADSGNMHQRGFCPTCGSQLFARFSHLPGLFGIKAGTLDDASGFVPGLDFWVASAAPWDFMDPELPKKQGAPRS